MKSQGTPPPNLQLRIFLIGSLISLNFAIEGTTVDCLQIPFAKFLFPTLRFIIFLLSKYSFPTFKSKSVIMCNCLTSHSVPLHCSIMTTHIQRQKSKKSLRRIFSVKHIEQMVRFLSVLTLFDISLLCCMCPLFILIFIFRDLHTVVR